MKTIKLIVMLLCILVMLAIPVSTIYRWNLVRSTGAEFKFKCQLLDPVDYLRGRYLTLDFNSIVDLGEPLINYKANKKIYVTIKVGNDGYATFDKAYSQKPKSSVYIEANSTDYMGEVYLPNGQTRQNAMRIEVPFNRYYMDEIKAPKADIQMRNNIRNNQNVYLKVKILNSLSAPVGLYINDKPIEETV